MDKNEDASCKPPLNPFKGKHIQISGKYAKKEKDLGILLQQYENNIREQIENTVVYIIMPKYTAVVSQSLDGYHQLKEVQIKGK